MSSAAVSGAAKSHETAEVVVVLNGSEYRVCLPDWGRWLDILDNAAIGENDAAQPDVNRLLGGWLRASVECRAAGQRQFEPLRDPAALPATVADELVEAGTQFLQAEKARLGLQLNLEPGCGNYQLLGSALHFVVKPLSFSERNACLRPSLRLHNGEPQIDASGYELALVGRSVVNGESGEALSYAELRALPVSVGELLVQAARELSDPPAASELKAFADHGQPHPDLELAALCLTFGMTPAEAEALPAATAKRLQAAAQLLMATGSAAAAAQGVVETMNSQADNVTRIVVHDD